MSHGVIVVGVDGSDESRAALRFAVEEARLRNAALRVVHAWSIVPQVDLRRPLPEDWPATTEAEADELVGAFVGETLGESPDVDVTAHAVHGTAAAVLLEAARDAELLVVGSRGLGGFAGLLLGSVGQQCACHAPCPLVIVRGARLPVEPSQARESGVGVEGR